MLYAIWHICRHVNYLGTSCLYKKLTSECSYHVCRGHLCKMQDCLTEKTTRVNLTVYQATLSYMPLNLITLRDTTLSGAITNVFNTCDFSIVTLAVSRSLAHLVTSESNYLMNRLQVHFLNNLRVWDVF